MNKAPLLILGASSDFGCELIRQLIPDQPVILAHHCRSGDKIKALRAGPGRIIPIAADFSNESEIAALIEMVKKACGGAPGKIVHLPAPPATLIRFESLTWEDFQKNIDIQLRSIFLILNEFLPMMADGDGGKVVLMLSSVTLNVPPKALAHYVTAKYALLGLMKAMASEYAGKKISINAVSPSMTHTRFLLGLPQKLVEIVAEQHPLGRNARTEDVVPLIRFLLSVEAGYLTGVNIPVAGGLVF